MDRYGGNALYLYHLFKKGERRKGENSNGGMTIGEL